MSGAKWEMREDGMFVDFTRYSEGTALRHEGVIKRCPRCGRIGEWPRRGGDTSRVLHQATFPRSGRPKVHVSCRVLSVPNDVAVGSSMREMDGSRVNARFRIVEIDGDRVMARMEWADGDLGSQLEFTLGELRYDPRFQSSTGRWT